ncbi:MAG: LamG domain-containing protein [Verrucomicrobiaceae bacterium]|nr:MAG: LamG domain-containing protein [Verrucomicrobiaceae bacterium]
MESVSGRLHHPGRTPGGVTPAQAASIKLTATNLIGPATVTDTSAPAVDTPFSAAVRADSPLAWFRFNEKTGSQLIVDSAENVKPHNGSTLTSSVSTGATGFVDGAGRFDGTRGIVTDRIVDFTQIEEGFTIEAIVRNEPDATGNANRAIVSQLDKNGTGRLIISVDDSGTIRSVLGAGVRKDADTKVLGRTWSHVVVVANALTNTLRWYVDGVYAGTSADGQNPDGSSFDPNLLFESSEGDWTIGVHKTLTANFWKGEIDEIAIYDTILDEVPGATPEAPAVIDTTRIVAHRNAWYSETSGLLNAGLSATSIEPGGSTVLTLKVGSDVTSVTIPGVGTYPANNGTVVITLSPSATITYQITLNGTAGPVVVPVTVTVNGVVPAAPLTLVSGQKSGGNFILNFTGAPNTVYYIRGSTNLTSFPLDHSSVTTDASGAGVATIPVDPAKPQEFFRVQSQP